MTVGVAFSFQKHRKLPINQNDVRLDLIITKNFLMNLLILGDIMKLYGRKALSNKLPDLIKIHNIDFVIVNGENASNDGEVTQEITEDFFKIGVDVITLEITFGIRKKQQNL